MVVDRVGVRLLLSRSVRPTTPNLNYIFFITDGHTKLPLIYAIKDIPRIHFNMCGTGKTSASFGKMI